MTLDNALARVVRCMLLTAIETLEEMTDSGVFGTVLSVTWPPLFSIVTLTSSAVLLTRWLARQSI